jgi:23S rRNA (uracil1939-C5)-methyltransferase
MTKMKLTIEKLVYGGDGLARVEQPDGKRKTVFVPLVLPGERVEATIVEERPGFARAKLEQVIEPSPARTEPACPYFGECGGCHYQHATYEEQLNLKREILRETVARIAKIELLEIATHAAEPLHYRNRTRLKFAVTAGGDTKFEIGYHKLGSHLLLAVRECPISSPLINRALAAMWKLAAEHDLPKGLAEVELFADHADAHLLVELLVSPGSDQKELTKFAEALAQVLDCVVGVVAVPRESNDLDTVAAPELEPVAEQRGTLLLGRSYLDYEASGFTYRVNAGSFFQTNRYLTDSLLKLACGDAEGKLAIDLYAGVGLFALPLAKRFERVIAVEAASASFADLKSNAPRNAKTVEATTEVYLTRGAAKADLVVVDPPRAGLGKKVVAGLVKLKPKTLVYVSCDPSTLARDLPGLVSAGYRVTKADLVDLFPQTFHIETVLRMER